jgi:hypothetical protein
MAFSEQHWHKLFFFRSLHGKSTGDACVCMSFLFVYEYCLAYVVSDVELKCDNADDWQRCERKPSLSIAA